MEDMVKAETKKSLYLAQQPQASAERKKDDEKKDVEENEDE
jgi:hypothetical protein